MPEQVKKIIDKIVEWWKKFNNKQRIILISAFSVIMIALIILGVVMTTPSYEHLHVCKDYAEAAKIKELLSTDESIDYTFNESTLSFSVKEEDVATASMLLGSSQIELTSYNINNVVDGSFAMTEADKQKKYQDYLEQKFASHISDLSMVESATVTLTLPENITVKYGGKEGQAQIYKNNASKGKYDLYIDGKKIIADWYLQGQDPPDFSNPSLNI